MPRVVGEHVRLQRFKRFGSKMMKLRKAEANSILKLNVQLSQNEGGVSEPIDVVADILLGNCTGPGGFHGGA